MHLYFFTVALSLGNIYDSKRSGPGRWMVVGIILAFSLKKASKAGSKSDGMGGCMCRRIKKFLLCYVQLLQNWNARTNYVKKLGWADGLWRLCKIDISAFLED
jgi:hypothetical protein